MRKILLLLLFIVSYSSCSSGIHRITDADFLQLCTQKRYSNYNPEKLFLETCCELGELPLKVLPKSVEYNRKNQTVFIEGRIVDGESGEIFPGIDVIVGTLEKINETQWYINVASRTRVNENGYFRLNASLRRENYLYFATTGYRVYEYEIGKLVQ